MSEDLGVYWDAEDPLKPVDAETRASNAALNDYARMGFSRSLRNLHKKYKESDDPPTDKWSTLCNWSATYDWQERVKKWDAIEQEHDEKVWRERRNEIRRKEWDNFYRLQEIIEEFLKDMPHFIDRKEKLIEDGTPEVIDSNGNVVRKGKPNTKVVTLKFKVSEAIRFITTASDIGRKAAELDKDMNNLLKEVDFEKLTPEQISRVAEGEHLLDVLGIRK
jgi:hypothetical protein